MSNTHEHSHTANSPEETLALLKYMAQHNAHHALELHEASHGVPNEASDFLHEAVDLLEQSTEKIKKAIQLLEE